MVIRKKESLPLQVLFFFIIILYILSMDNPSQDLEKERPGRRNNTHKTHSEVSLVLPGTERRFSRMLQVGKGRYVGGTNET